MDLSRLGRGQVIAAAGGLLLLLSLLFFDWYGVGTSVETGFGTIHVGGSFGAWDGQGFLGTLANLVILAGAVAAVGLAVLTAASRTVALPVAASALTASLGIAAAFFVLMRMLFQPGPNDLVDLKFSIYLALVGAVAIAFGGWEGMQEEGTSFGQARNELQDRLGGGTHDRPASGRRRTRADGGTEPPPTTVPPPSRSEPAEPPPADVE